MLWKKVNTSENAMYENPFANIQIEFAQELKQWNEQLIEFGSPEIVQRSEKSNRVSDQLMEYGHIEFRSHNWNEALNLYTWALCFAEPNTLYEGLAHGNRALCFFQMEMYQKAMIDFDFAMQNKCPEQFIANVQASRAQCEKLVKKQTNLKLRTPKLRISTDKKFPCMVNLLELNRNKDYGRCVVAKRDIEIGTYVFVAENFASTVTSDKQAYCLSCHKTEMNFIPCKNCSDVMFCNEDCANWDSIHKWECQSTYHHIEDISVKFVVQTILVAIDMFSDANNLIKFVEDVIVDKGCDKIPKTSCDSMSKYGIFLTLTPSYKNEYLLRAYQAFTCLLLIPKVNYLFDTMAKRRFLKNLVLHHTVIIPKNAFCDIARYSDQFSVKYIFDVLSIINHSCAPNLNFATMGNLGYCVSVRPIKKGDQVFINYLGDDVHKPLDQRKKSLLCNWGFECKCDKCEVAGDTPEHEFMKTDPALKYIIRNFEHDQCTTDSAKRFQLKKQCIKFLKKFGHLSWSSELEFVINCFTSL